MLDLSPVKQKFILHWGEMGTRWGINRTMAQIHALLFSSPRPLNAEEIAETLSVARSNVSTSLHELQGWGIVKVVHVMGDRRDHFESLKDVWQMFRVVMDERRKREMDPTQQLLRECVEESNGKSDDAYTHARLSELLDFFDVMFGWYDQMRRLPTPGLIRVLKWGDRAAKMLGARSH